MFLVYFFINLYLNLSAWTLCLNANCHTFSKCLISWRFNRCLVSSPARKCKWKKEGDNEQFRRIEHTGKLLRQLFGQVKAKKRISAKRSRKTSSSAAKHWQKPTIHSQSPPLCFRFHIYCDFCFDIINLRFKLKKNH